MPIFLLQGHHLIEPEVVSDKEQKDQETTIRASLQHSRRYQRRQMIRPSRRQQKCEHNLKKKLLKFKNNVVHCGQNMFALSTFAQLKRIIFPVRRDAKTRSQNQVLFPRKNLR